MKKGLIAVGVVVLIVLMFTGSLIGRYNGFVTSNEQIDGAWACLLYTSPSPRDGLLSRMPSSA